jgi:imidazolonepropionase-like amidohydrolase
VDKSIVFQNAFLIDGNGDDPVEGATVVIENQKIADVWTNGKGGGSLPQKARIIDLYGKTLMPGLIDAHVHIGNIEMRMDRTVSLPPAVYVHRATQNLETDLQLGFTTLRDAAGLDWGFRSAIEQGLIRGPRLFLSVAPLSQTGGHGDKRLIGQNMPIPRNSIGIYPEICDGIDEVRKSARRVLRWGANQVKVMADGGVASPTDKIGHWQFTVDELKAAVEVAKSAGTYVMAHVYAPDAISNCVKAGVRSLEHGNLLDADNAKQMAENGSYLVPTLTVYDVLEKEGSNQGLDAFTLEKMKAVRSYGLRSLELAYKAGVKIGSGSDIIGPFQFLKGREFAIKGEVMTPMETIVAATRTNAELLNVSENLGTIEPGKLADMIAVDGNPLKDLSLFEQGLKTVVMVMKDGQIMKNLLD